MVGVRLNSIFFALAILCVTGCGNHRVPSVNDEGVEEGLRHASADWDVLFNNGLAARLVTLYAADGYTMPPNLATIKGRPALIKDFDELFTAYIVHQETRVDEFLINDDRAIELSHYTLTLQRRPDGEVVTETGRRVVCRRKNATRWEIIWELWNTDGPPRK